MMKVRALSALLVAVANSQYLVTNPRSCQLSGSANSRQYYNTPNYNCLDCGVNAMQDPKNLQQCTCLPGYRKKDGMDFEFKFDCEACSGSQAPSRD